MVATVILGDAPELLALAQLASVAPSKIAAAFTDPIRFFDHMTLEELERLNAACERMAVLQKQMIAAMETYKEAQEFLDGASGPPEPTS